MRIEEIDENANLLLHIEAAGGELELPVILYKKVRKGIIIHPVKKDNVAISFESLKECKLSLIMEVKDSKPILWRNIQIGNIKSNGELYTAILAMDEGAVYNRRGAFRLELDINGNLTGYGKVLIHDISSGGISFYLPNGQECHVGQEINLHFDTKASSYNISGEVVRMADDAEKGRVMYGCKTKHYPAVDAFISEEHRKRVWGNRKR